MEELHAKQMDILQLQEDQEGIALLNKCNELLKSERELELANCKVEHQCKKKPTLSNPQTYFGDICGQLKKVKNCPKKD